MINFAFTFCHNFFPSLSLVFFLSSYSVDDFNVINTFTVLAFFFSPLLPSKFISFIYIRDAIHKRPLKKILNGFECINESKLVNFISVCFFFLGALFLLISSIKAIRLLSCLHSTLY